MTDSPPDTAPTTTFADFRALSIRAYICLFGAFFGYATYGGQTYDAHTHSTSSGLLLVWVLMGLLGAVLVCFKDRKIADPRWNTLVAGADMGVTILLVLLALLLPGALGTVRGMIVLVVASAYVTVYVKLLYGGKLVGPEQG